MLNISSLRASSFITLRGVAVRLVAEQFCTDIDGKSQVYFYPLISKLILERAENEVLSSPKCTGKRQYLILISQLLGSLTVNRNFICIYIFMVCFLFCSLFFCVCDEKGKRTWTIFALSSAGTSRAEQQDPLNLNMWGEKKRQYSTIPTKRRRSNVQ